MNADAHTTGEASPSRRRLLKTGVAATGAAYIAPQILNTAVAGAQTTTCYAFKIGSGIINPGPPINDPSCDSGFNGELAAAATGTISTNQTAGLALINITAGGLGQQSITVEVTGAGCTLAFFGAKAGNSCYPTSDASVSITNGGKTGTFVSPDRPGPPGPADISHMTLVVCCTGSP